MSSVLRVFGGLLFLSFTACSSAGAPSGPGDAGELDAGARPKAQQP
jgi:hypothetical protein